MSPSKKTTAPKRDKEASKKRLLEAGLEVFSKYGYDAATTRMVAAKAKLNEQLITRYFGGKAGLLLAMLLAFLEQEAQQESYPPAAATVEEEIRNGLLHRHTRLLALQEFLRIFVPRLIVDPSIRDRVQMPLFKHTSRRLVERLASLQEQGLIRKDADLERTSMIIVGHSFYVSFLLRICTKMPDADLIPMLTEFAGYMARGLSRE